MPQFLLQYKLPEDFDTFEEEKKYRARMVNLAEKIKVLIIKLFDHMVVTYEVREFGTTDNQVDISVTATTTDNDDDPQILATVLNAQKAILGIMKQESYIDEVVDCNFQIVKGKWSGGCGFKHRSV